MEWSIRYYILYISVEGNVLSGGNMKKTLSMVDEEEC